MHTSALLFLNEPKIVWYPIQQTILDYCFLCSELLVAYTLQNVLFEANQTPLFL